MRIVLGVHVSTYEATASLVDVVLPELGAVASRTVQVSAAPGGIVGAVSTALGFMRVQALQNGLEVTGAAIVCENALQREIVADAIASVESEPVLVVDIFDPRLSDGYPPDTAVALLVGTVDPVVRSGRTPAAARDRRGIWPVAAIGACVLAALGGVSAWAMTAAPSGSSAPADAVYTTSDSAARVTTKPIPPAGASASSVPQAPAAETIESRVVVVPAEPPVVQAPAVLPPAVRPPTAPPAIVPPPTSPSATPPATPTTVPTEPGGGDETDPPTELPTSTEETTTTTTPPTDSTEPDSESGPGAKPGAKPRPGAKPSATPSPAAELDAEQTESTSSTI